MKEKQIEYKSYNTVYEAVDGTEFADKAECYEYEKTCACAIKARLKQIAIKVDTEDCLLKGSCKTTIFVIQPKTDTDIFVTHQALSLHNRNNAESVSNADIGRVLLVGFTYNDDYVFVMKLDEIVRNITDGKYVVVKKEEE